MKADGAWVAPIVNRIRADYLEMPGMSLRVEQVARLCGADRDLCKTILDAMVDAKFLVRKADGAYTRRTGDMSELSLAHIDLDADEHRRVRRRRG